MRGWSAELIAKDRDLQAIVSADEGVDYGASCTSSIS